MACEEAHSECAGDACATTARVPLTHTTGSRPNRWAAYEPMHGGPTGPTVGGELPHAADGVTGDGADPPQLPGLEAY